MTQGIFNVDVRTCKNMQRARICNNRNDTSYSISVLNIFWSLEQSMQFNNFSVCVHLAYLFEIVRSNTVTNTDQVSWTRWYCGLGSYSNRPERSQAVTLWVPEYKWKWVQQTGTEEVSEKTNDQATVLRQWLST